MASSSATRPSSPARESPPSWAVMVSAIWSPALITGLRAFIAPWGIRETRANRTCRISSSERPSSSCPPSQTRPDSILPGGRMRRMSAMAVVDLPDPDSPTSPRHSPRPILKPTPSAASTGPLPVR